MSDSNENTVSSPWWFNKAAEETVSPLHPRIIGIQTHRSAQMPVSENEPQESDQEFVINVFYGINDENPHILLIGDLFVVKEGTLAGVSTSCSISVSSGELMNDSSAEAIGYWAAHVLYDVTVSKWKELTSSSYLFSATTFPEAPEEIKINRFNVNEEQSS